jgi:hypothetical protein
MQCSPVLECLVPRLAYESTLIHRFAKSAIRLTAIAFLWILGCLFLEPARAQSQAQSQPQPQLNKPSNKPNNKPPQAPAATLNKVPKSAAAPQTSAGAVAPVKENGLKRNELEDRKRLRQEIRASTYGSASSQGDSLGLSPEERAQLRQQIRDHHKTSSAAQPPASVTPAAAVASVPAAEPARAPRPVYNRPMEADK